MTYFQNDKRRGTLPVWIKFSKAAAMEWIDSSFKNFDVGNAVANKSTK